MSSAQEFNCIFCKETFDNKEALQIHFRKHGDPKFNQSNNKSRSQNEAPMSSEKSNDRAEMVGCDVCSEMFLTISKAITHKHKVHPDHDAKYFCPWCGKLFTMKHLYNKHLQANHIGAEANEDNNFHCNCCNVDFNVPAAMLYHNKFFHRQETDLPAIGQSKKLKLYNQEVIPIYYCAFCGEEYDNKVNLHKHINDEHNDENQSPDEVLRCPLCDAIFYHLDAYELHLTFHSIEDLYSEKNEMMNEITEFSLESVPPGVEKVESFEPQEEAETAMNAVGIEKFLELAMDQSDDQASAKVRKHKKHKKSKKSAITLDEFLNMNKDVFGEGIDFQGIEEVPTQVVAKRLKSNKKQTQPSKFISSSEIQKLKRQGIVVKKKSGLNTASSPDVARGRQVVNQIPKQSVKISHNSAHKAKPVSKTESNILSTSSEVLSKLINQSNNQIKIVKKSNQENTNTDNRVIQQDTINTSVEKTMPPDTKVMKDDELGSAIKETEEKTNAEDNNELISNVNKISELSDTAKDSSQDSQNTSKSGSSSPILNGKKDTESYDNLLNKDDDDDNHFPNSKNDHNSNSSYASEDITEESNFNKKSKGTNVVDPLNALRNKANIVVKSATSSKNFFPETSTNSNTPTINYDIEVNHDQSNTDWTENSSPNNSLNALKHLSHLITIKPVNQIKKSALTDVTEVIEQNSHHVLDDKANDINVDLPETKPEKGLAFNTLKNLSKNITVKTMSQSSTISSKNYQRGDSDDDIDENYEVDEVTSKNIMQRQNKIPAAKTLMSIKSPDLNVKPIRHSPTVNKSAVETDMCDEFTLNDDMVVKKPANTILLKHLTDVTAKPLSKIKNVGHQTQQQTTLKSISQYMSTVNRNTTTKSLQREEFKEEIEIFNVDDSDSDDIDNGQSSKNQSIPVENSKTAPKSMEALKNLSKHITVKSVDIKKSNSFNESTGKEFHSDETLKDANNSNHTENFNIVDNKNTQPMKAVNTNLNTPNISNKQTAINHALKNLGKNITVTSRNSSPSQSVKSQDQNTQDSNMKPNDNESDSDSCSSNVKITEMDNASDDEYLSIHTDKTKARNIEDNGNIQYPDDSNSDDHLGEKFDEHVSDFEAEIKINKLKKTNLGNKSTVNPTCLNNLKNISKDITIKSLNENTFDKEDQSPSGSAASVDIPEISKSRNNPLSVKPFKQTKNNFQKESLTSVDRNIKNVTQVTGRSLNHSAINQQMSSSVNKFNTVNKEVTVKTIQTETNTVIEEITTTVTKTIKTVNQSMKQEVRNMCHVSSTPIVVPQKVQGMMSNQQSKNIPGIAVRHSSPMIGPRIRSAAPVIGTTVRPSNQLVPMRTGLNVARLSTPRMPNTKNIRPSTSVPQRLQVGKPVKVSPDAVMQTASKRPISEEATGHFSCFKKPKESLIPVSDVPVFKNDVGESRLQFTSASQMSRSNFTSTTKTVKGNSVVTSTQMKSEVSSSSQQLTRLRNMSGLSIVKTSQAKQAQVEKKSEVSETKRTTLEAIQKLQKQGLLVKKPRLQEDEHSDPGSDDNTGQNSNEDN